MQQMSPIALWSNVATLSPTLNLRAPSANAFWTKLARPLTRTALLSTAQAYLLLGSNRPGSMTTQSVRSMRLGLNWVALTSPAHSRTCISAIVTHQVIGLQLGGAPNIAFKPKLHRYAVHMAETACHVPGYALQFGLT